MEKFKYFSYKGFYLSVFVIWVIVISYSYLGPVINPNDVCDKCFVEQAKDRSACFDRLCFEKDGALSFTSYFPNGKIKDVVESNACNYKITKNKLVIKVLNTDISREYEIKWINKNSFHLIDDNDGEVILALKGSSEDKTKID